MGLLGEFGPKRTRSVKNESRGSKTRLPEVRSSPVQEIKQPDQEDLIDQYEYKQDKNQDYLGAIAQDEQSLVKQDKVYCPDFGFYELMPMCEEHLLAFMYGAHDPKFRDINISKRGFIYAKLGIMADSKKEIYLGAFKDYLFYYKGEVLLPEEFKQLSGFLREYFQIEKVAVLYNTGEIIIRESGYCSFWFKDRLNRYFSGALRELNHTEVQSEDSCLDCIYNYNCQFSKKNYGN